MVINARYATIKDNDTTNGEGVCVSVWMQGCPHRCKGCHNPETWDPAGGYEANSQTIKDVLAKIAENGVMRNLSILGGEPLSSQNSFFVGKLISEARRAYPKIKIFLWTGYTLEELLNTRDEIIYDILEDIDILIDGRFILEQRDITLKFRGSPNQQIYDRETILQKIKSKGALK